MKNNLKKISSFAHEVILLGIWAVAILYASLLKKNNQKNVYMIIPSDLAEIIGAKGDEAMMSATFRMLREASTINPAIHIGATAARARGVIEQLGAQHFKLWGSVMMPFLLLKNIQRISPSAAYVMGADIMDGYYSPVTSLRMIIAADLMSRMGAHTSFLGFSFNDKPHGMLKIAFKALHNKVLVNLRDPISLDRYHSFTNTSATLVADTAFLLKENNTSEVFVQISNWIAEQRNQNRKVFAINFHPMLFKGITANDDLITLSKSIQSMMGNVTSKENLSWLLLPHDDREEAGDISSLKNLYEKLSPDVRAHAHLVLPPPTAAEIKAIVGQLDGVVTGRMHLAIATLGMGVPVLALAYQAKFEGLSQHFGLPAWTVMDPKAAFDVDYLTKQVEHFVTDLPVIKAQVANKLPDVKRLSKSTFRNIE